MDIRIAIAGRMPKMLDKNTESYIQTPDKPGPTLSGYTLYPDAGDIAGLDTPEVLPETPPPLPQPAAASPPTVFLPRSVPKSDIPTPPRTPHNTAKISPPWPRRLFRLLCFFFILSALAVYGNLLLAGGRSLLAKGIDTLALQHIFGSAQEVTVIPQLPQTETQQPTNIKIAETIPPAPDIVPPASELPVPAADAAIMNMDLSSDASDGLGLINETPYTPDLAALAVRPSVIDSYDALESIYGKNCPAVLILHTHGTEAFADHADTGYHTENRSENICAVGKSLADTLQAADIGVIHCTELFDADSFDMAYYNAARYIRKTVEEHPSIRYILDIHRDAITAEDGTGIRPLSLQSGTEYAQLMFVVGTDHGGSGHTDWEINLTLAARLQSALHTENPTLMRDINLRSASFNAQYAPGALLVEAGAAASSLEEAIRSMEVFGKALIKEILGE